MKKYNEKYQIEKSLPCLLSNIRNCDVCSEFLPLEPKPILSVNSKSTVVIIGQAPGIRVHMSNIPWNDQSGERLRNWMNISNNIFYDETKISIVPMGFCYPGKGQSGDLPPRKECAILWHDLIFKHLFNLKLVILIGTYAQNYYLKDKKQKTLTDTVKNFDFDNSIFFPIPHPSPRNEFWFKKNPWFEKDILPKLKNRIHSALKVV